jgi:serine/threonine protein kinase
MPDHLSPECQDLLIMILNPDPYKRFTIQDITSHPWYN